MVKSTDLIKTHKVIKSLYSRIDALKSKSKLLKDSTSDAKQEYYIYWVKNFQGGSWKTQAVEEIDKDKPKGSYYYLYAIENGEGTCKKQFTLKTALAEADTPLTDASQPWYKQSTNDEAPRVSTRLAFDTLEYSEGFSLGITPQLALQGVLLNQANTNIIISSGQASLANYGLNAVGFIEQFQIKLAAGGPYLRIDSDLDNLNLNYQSSLFYVWWDDFDTKWKRSVYTNGVPSGVFFLNIKYDKSGYHLKGETFSENTNPSLFSTFWSPVAKIDENSFIYSITANEEGKNLDNNFLGDPTSWPSWSNRKSPLISSLPKRYTLNILSEDNEDGIEIVFKDNDSKTSKTYSYILTFTPPPLPIPLITGFDIQQR